MSADARKSATDVAARGKAGGKAGGRGAAGKDGKPDASAEPGAVSNPGAEHSIVVRDLKKEYRIYPGSFARFKEAMLLGKRKFHMAHRALDGVSFEVEKGRALGIIGENGAGKSTLLKILAGTTLPTGGSFEIRGSVASLLELGTGFHAEFTGRDNIFLAAQVQGFKKAEIAEKVDGIIKFAELGDYIDQPVRTYSSGMVMRLGFSVATAIDPEVLIIDEILAVGDLYFQKKCIDRIFEFRERGKSILFCSHSLYDIRQVCDEVIWIDDARVRQRGLPQDVTVAYANYERSLISDPDAAMSQHTQLEGEGLPAILEVRLLNAATNELVEGALQPGADLIFEIDFIIRAPRYVVHLGVGLFRNDNIVVSSFSSMETDLPSVPEPGRYRARLELPKLELLEGEYHLVAYLLDATGVHVYDHRQLDQGLLMSHEQNTPGIVRLAHSFTLDPLDSRS